MMSKGKIAAISAVGVAVAFLIGGYGVSVAKFEPALNAAEQKIADYINQEFKLSERQAVSLEFHETPESGLLSRKLNLVIADPQNNIQIPIDASIGFLSYKFVADLPQSSFNGQKLFDMYREDLDKLTKLDMTAKTHVLTGKSEVLLEAVGLNDARNALIMVKSAEERQALEEDAEAFAKSKDFGAEGSFDMRLTFDRDQNFELTGKMHDVLTPELAVKSMTFTSSGQGIGKDIRDLGNMELKLEDLYSVSLFTTHHVQNATLTTDATPFDEQGNFNMKVALVADSINQDIKNLNLSLGCNGLNYPGLIELSERMIFSSTAGIDYLQQYPFDMEIYPDTKLVYHDTTVGEDVEITAQGKMVSDAANKIEGNVSVNVDNDVNKLGDLSSFARYFKVDGEQSKSDIKFTLPFNGKAQFSINGQDM